MLLACKKESPVVPSALSGPDTTTHDFSFTQYDLGGNAGSSDFKDAVIVNDTLAYAVGEIFTTDSTGKPDPEAYSLAVWNGNKWSLRRLYFQDSGNNELLVPIRGVIIFNAADIWFAAGSIFHWDGASSITQMSLSRLTLPDSSATIEKLWGLSSNSIYGVGDAGTIVHYANGVWTRMQSGTNYDLTDVWGSPDGSVIWACGWRNYSVDTAQGILLRSDGTDWTTVWKRGSNTTTPYGDAISSLWGQTHLFTSSNFGVYIQSMSGIDTALQSLSVSHFPYRIRGSAENNVVMVGDFGMIWHYNQKGWKQINITSLDQPLYSVAVSTNMIIAVGSDYSVGLGAALIYRGTRISN